MLSIIMPVKNTELYLEECLDSIVNQSLQQWELIAVDDHSTDGSHEILMKYAAHDKRVHVILNEGKGVIDALQTGFKNAKGNYITRMDSDDINELHKYESMLNQLKEKGKGYLALGQVQYFAAGGLGDGFQKYEQWMNALISNGNCFEEVYKECVIPSPCWMLHREDFEHVGGFSSGMYPEDYDLCFRMYKHQLTPLACKELLFHWRDYPMRTTRQVAHYQGEALLKLKIYHFLDIDFDETKNLVIWGAGKRGKYIAKYLVEHNIPFTWVCNNDNKINHEIYGVKLKSENMIHSIESKQIVVAVANTEEQAVIRNIGIEQNWKLYYFC